MSQNTSSNKNQKPPGSLKDFLHAAGGPLTFILALIITCAFLAHYLTGSETLEEYARNNPPPSEDTAESETPDTDNSVGSGTPGPSSAYNNQDNVIAEDTPTSPEDESFDNLPPEPSAAPVEEEIDMTINADRTDYQPGFYYEPLNDTVKEKITGVSYPATDCTISYDDLRYVGLLYIDFNGEEQEGELICNKAVAQDMVEIFYELYRSQYQIERVRLIDEYGGDDTLSMEDNNTSCFNYRVVDGTTSLSKHALGCAIDINPFYNPYVVFNKDGTGETYISPKGSEIYADRSQDFPYKIDEADLCYKLFTEHGFTWGGHWNSCKDYQHFQIVLP